MGNDALHLKNLSLSLHRAQDSFLTLDLLANDHFTESYERLGFYTLEDFLELGRRLKIPERAVKNFASKLVSLEDKAVALIQNSFMPEPMRERAEAMVRERINVMSPG